MSSTAWLERIFPTISTRMGIITISECFNTAGLAQPIYFFVGNDAARDHLLKVSLWKIVDSRVLGAKCIKPSKQTKIEPVCVLRTAEEPTPHEHPYV